MSAHMYYGPESPELPELPDAPELPDEPDRPELPELPELPDGPYGTPLYRITDVLPRQAAPYGPAGEYPHPAAPAPAAAPADHEAPQPHPADRDDDQDTGAHPVLEDGEGEWDDDEAGDDGQDYEHEPARRALTLPDLRPYADIPAAARLLREYGPEGARLAWHGTKTATGWTGRTLAAGSRRLRAATAHVATVLRPVWLPLCTWCSKAPAQRIGGGAIAVFLAGHPLHAPGSVRIAAAIGWVIAVSATLAKTRDGDDKAKKKTKGKDDQAPVEVAKEDGPPPALTPDEDAPEDAPEDVDDTPDDTPGEDPEETPAEAPEPAPFVPPRPPSRDDLTRALHHLYRGGSGVLHTALKDHLHLPDTRAVRTALEVAGIPSRAGVRSGVGAAAVNSAGVHTSDFPPLPPHQDPPMGDGVGAGQSPNNNTNNVGEGIRKGMREVTTDYGLTILFPTETAIPIDPQ